MLLGATAFAASRLGLIEWFTYRDNRSGEEIVNEIVSAGVQGLDAAYESDKIRFTMEEAVYDAPGNTFAINWTVEKLVSDQTLYVVCEGIRFGGELAELRAGGGLDNYVLTDEATHGSVMGLLPNNAGPDGSISFSILSAKAEIVQVGNTNDAVEQKRRIAETWAKGRIPSEGQGVEIPVRIEAGQTYTEALLATGLFEMADAFTVNFTMDAGKLDSASMVCTSELDHIFDGYELHITRADVSATSAFFEVQYITEEKPLDGGKGIGPLWEVKFSVPGVDRWYITGSGSIEDPVQMEDGRWLNEMTWEAIGLYVIPDEVVMTLVTYDGTLDNATEHTDDAVVLTFSSNS